jgi:uncharacterized protein YwgA
MTKAEAVQQIIVTNRGRLAGKTRLQKTVYLLESAGHGYGFDFKYHYYGPYSEDLAIAANDAKALDFITISEDVSAIGMPLTIFEAKNSSIQDNEERIDKRKGILNILQKYDATSLELAATADFLEKNGYRQDPWSETRRRKSIKATPERVQKAKQLLEELRAERHA